MIPLPTVIAAACIALPVALAAQDAVKVVVEHNDDRHVRSAFRFATVPAPARVDAATTAKFSIVDGSTDANSASLDVLHDGKLPRKSDAPRANFFFGRGGGRLCIDLGSVTGIAQVDSYSWHPGARGPQVYKLYAADATAAGFDAAPQRGSDPLQCGWQLLATVDTRPATAEAGGQYGVSIAGTAGAIGRFRYLLFDVLPTGTDDAAGNTFYSEIDVRAVADPAQPLQPVAAKTDDGRFEISIDATASPELADWADDELMPVLLEWYPKIVAMLPSDGFAAPKRVTVEFQNPGRGVAATRGTHITCAAAWFQGNRRGEAVGAVVHELVHVAQQYGAARRRNPDAARAPGWLVEGIADYIRWFLFEPESRGADRVRNPAKARYDAGYRVSAHFLDWAARNHDANLVRKLNAALRDGTLTDALWPELTGKAIADLGQQWQDSLLPPAGINLLTEAERQAGWKLLFDGNDFDGWHSFQRAEVLPGWRIEAGTITCADPHNAGDLCTDAKYGEFELLLDYRIAAGGNSGVMFHVTDAGSTTWATGPECQLLDNKAGKDPQKAGWLYGLYRTDVDATRPAGEWNTLRILISKEKCEHAMNGVTYFDYVLHGDDFEQRLANSKFARMPLFAKSDSGYIALQGDHGLIAFRNVKIRAIEPKK